jgi:NDP-sugar pyrophosphorylase family protein
VLDAVVLAGGKGSRLGKSGRITPKCLFNFPDGPLIYILITELLKSDIGSICVSGGHLNDEVKHHVNKHFPDVSVFEQKTAIGTAADGLLAIEEHIVNDFLVVHADHFFSVSPFTLLLSQHQPTEVTFLFEEKGKFESFGYGIPCFVEDGSNELHFQPRRRNEGKQKVLVDGCMVLPVKIFDLIRQAKIDASARAKEKVEMMDVFIHADQRGLVNMKGVEVEGWWANVNDFATYADCLTRICLDRGWQSK